MNGPFSEQNGEVSPDGLWLAYQSNESGRDEIYVRPFPNVEGAGRWQVSTSGGTRPVWARNGRELFFFLPPGKVMAVSVEQGPTFTSGAVRTLFEGQYMSVQSGRSYDVASDGRFLMVKNAVPTDSASTSPPQLVVVVNWLEELKRLVPTN